MKHTLLLLLALFIAAPLFSQNEPVPSYVTTQDFPDSVKALGIRTVDDTKISLGDVLAKYKGKKVLVDIWASWCRDCIIGYPKVEELRRQVGEDNIAYVFLSVDKDAQKWKNAIGKFKIRGEHYLLDGAWKNPLSNYIALDWVPRYLVLDEQGRVIVPKAILAEDDALRNALAKKIE